MSNGFLQRTAEEDAPRRARRATTSTPRWVKVFVALIILLVLVFVILHLTGNGMGAHMHMDHRGYWL